MKNNDLWTHWMLANAAYTISKSLFRFFTNFWKSMIFGTQKVSNWSSFEVKNRYKINSKNEANKKVRSQRSARPPQGLWHAPPIASCRDFGCRGRVGKGFSVTRRSPLQGRRIYQWYSQLDGPHHMAQSPNDMKPIDRCVFFPKQIYL